jgi:putative endopeptidase
LERVLDAEYEAIGEDIGRVYADRYFDSSSKARMQEMVSNLKKAFRKKLKI